MGYTYPPANEWRFRMLTKDSPAIDKVILKCIAMSPTTANKLQIATGYALNTVNIALREGVKQKRIHVCAYERNGNSWAKIYLGGPGKNVQHPRFKAKVKASKLPPRIKKPAPVTEPVVIAPSAPTCSWLGI